MSLPKTVKSGAFKLRVRRSDRSGDISSDHDGEYDSVTKNIYIHSDVKRDRQVEVLVHELLHSAFEQAGFREIKALRKREEWLCTVLSPWVIGLIRSNPKLVEYIRETK